MVSIANFACAVVTYIVLGGYKLRRSAGEAAAVKEHFTKEQTISLVALLIMVVMVVGFSYDVGLICFTLSLVILLRTADEKKAIKMIPWNVLILIAGVSVLMNITQTMGGIELLSNILASFMNSVTAAPLYGIYRRSDVMVFQCKWSCIPNLDPNRSGYFSTGRRCLCYADDRSHRMQRYGSRYQSSVYRRKPDHGKLHPGIWL